MARAYADSSDTYNGSALQLVDFVRLLRTHVSWWAVPAVVCAIVAGVYSLVTPREWKATQALVVRPEVASVSDERLGKFADLSEMKTSQETVLELAKSQNVIQAALRQVGPPSGYRHADAWPTALDVEAFRDHVDMRPPGGAEFGKTEVFYLSVSDSDRDRSSALVVALCNQLEHRLQDVRAESAHGMISELERTVAMANDDLSAQTDKLSAFEGKIGADLGELRSLNADAGSQSGVSQEIIGIESDRRANEGARNEHERLLTVLTAAKDDTAQLLATPNSLLISQPALSQLKNALVSAQLRTSELLSSRSENHPFVVAAREAENQIRNQLNNEISVAIRGQRVELQLCGDREKALVAHKVGARERVSQLAASRAEYTNLVASVQNHSRLVEAAQKNLADARARSAAAHSASVISRIDGVEAGIRPAGPARKTVAAAGGVGGLLVGFGFVFLFASPPVAPVTIGVSTLKSNIASTVANGSHSHQSENEVFGMFRGLSLQQAVHAVQRRCR